MKPIETVFDGHLFRSRGEARWAVFLKALGIDYKYELEGYDLSGTWYLPDFFIPTWQSWIEVKPESPSEQEVWKCRELARETQKTCLLLYGEPWMRTVKSGGYEHGTARYQWEYRFTLFPGNDVNELDNCVFAECPGCSSIGFFAFYEWKDHSEYAGSGRLDPSCCGREQDPIIDAPRLVKAYSTARQARFEHK
jgi:hypothetical protein